MTFEDDDDDEDDASSASTSDSSSCATSDDRMLLETKPRVARRRKKDAPVPMAPPAESLNKKMKKKKKKASLSSLEAALATLPQVQSSDATKETTSPTRRKKKSAAVADGSPVKKSTVKDKQPITTKSSYNTESSPSSTREAGTTTNAAAAHGSPPTKKKKEKALLSSMDGPGETAAAKQPEVEDVSPRQATKDVKKPKKKAAAASAAIVKKDEGNARMPTEAAKKNKKKTTKQQESIMPNSNSLPKRPQTAPTVCKKKVTLSSDDDSSVENAYVVPSKTPPPISPQAKSKFAFASSDDDDSWSDSSDSSHERKKRRAWRHQPAAKEDDPSRLGNAEESHAPDNLEPHSLPEQNQNSDDSDSSSDGDDSGLPMEPRRNERRGDAMAAWSVPPRTLSGESTDSEPPFPLDLRPGRRQVIRSMSLGSTDGSEAPFSQNSRPGQLSRSISNGTTDSEPPFPLSLRPGGGPPRMDSGNSTDTEPPFSFGLQRGAPARFNSNSSSSDSEPPFPLGLRPGASIGQQQAFGDDGRPDDRPDDDRTGGRIVRPPSTTFSAESTDSEPPFSLSLRPGAPAKEKPTAPAGELPDWATAGNAILRPLSKTVSAESTDSEPPFSLTLRPVAPAKGIASIPAEEYSDGTSAAFDPTYGPECGARLHQSEARKSKPLVPCPSYVPSCQDPADVAKYLGRELFSTESKPSDIASFKEGNASCSETGRQLMDGLALTGANARIGSCHEIGKPQRRASVGSTCTGRTIGSLFYGFQEGACGHTAQGLNEPHFATEVKLRPVVSDIKPKKKKRSRRRESYLFKDLQRFAKKAAKEIQSDDEGVSDDGVSDYEALSDDDGRNEFCGDQSLNLHDAIDHSESQVSASGPGPEFHQSTPVMPLHTAIGGASIVNDPITPRFEEIRRKFLRETAKNHETGIRSPGRRHSSLIATQGQGIESPSRRHSTIATDVPSLVLQNDDSQGFDEVENSREIEKTDQRLRQVPDRAPSVSLSNVISLKDRIKLLSLDDTKGHVKAGERTSSEQASPLKNRFPIKLTNDHTTSHGNSIEGPVSSAMDALLSPRKTFTSKPSINRPYGAQTVNDRVQQVHVKADKPCFKQSMGNIPPSSSSQPTKSDKATIWQQNKKNIVDNNNDSLENLRVMAEALQQEIDEADNNNDPSPNSEADDAETSDNDRFDASINAGNGLGQCSSTKNNQVSTKAEDDDKSLESTISYDVQDVFFSQQRKLALQRARAERSGGGKLGDRLKFLQSS
jgi:hypothetical protein